MEIQPIKTVTFFENILCMYRNIAAFGKLTKFLGYMRIVFELIFIIYNTTLHVIHHLSFVHQTEGLFFFSSIVNSILLVCLACWYSKEFVQLSNHLQQNHTFFESDKDYNKKLVKIQRNTILVAATFCFVHVLSFIVFRYARHFNITGVSSVVKYMLHTHLALCDHRFIFEYIALCTILTVMSEQLHCMVRSIDDVEKVMKNGFHAGNEHNRAHLEIFDKFGTIYTNIKEVSKLFNIIYGLQITVMLASIVFYFIICLYLVSSQSVKGELSFLGSLFYVFSTCLLLLILALLSRSAQRAQNLATTLRRRLGRMLIHTLDCPTDDYYKSTRDLIRLIATRPIRTQAFGSISVDMTLIPTCVLFFTYYVVIALQFNNVV